MRTTVLLCDKLLVCLYAELLRKPDIDIIVVQTSLTSRRTSRRICEHGKGNDGNRMQALLLLIIYGATEQTDYNRSKTFVRICEQSL